MKYALALLGAATALAMAPAAHARIYVGDGVDIEYYNPEFGKEAYWKVVPFTGDGQVVDMGYFSVTLYSYKMIFEATADLYILPADWTGPVAYEWQDPTRFAGWEVLKDDIGVTKTYFDPDAVGFSWAGVGDVNKGQEIVIGSAAPEPTTWALMIAGVAMAGGALRARWRSATA